MWYRAFKGKRYDNDRILYEHDIEVKLFPFSEVQNMRQIILAGI